MLQRLAPGDYSDAMLVFGKTRSVQAKGLIAVGAKTTVKHSRNEARLLEFIPADGSKQTTADLVRKFYRGKSVPMNARISIMNLVRSIKAKGIVSLKTSERAGPNPIEVWR